MGSASGVYYQNGWNGMSTARYAPRTAEMRLFESDSPGAFESFDAFASILWIRPNVVGIYGMRGKVTRTMVWELGRSLYQRGARIIYAERAPGKHLPFGEQIDEGDFSGMWRIDLQRFVKRVGDDA